MDSKTCSKCGERKPLDEFHRESGRKYGVTAHCKVCRVEQQRNYREQNRDTVREREREYYERNREIVLENRRIYHEQNHEKIRERKRKYYKENRERIAERSRIHCRRITDTQKQLRYLDLAGQMLKVLSEKGKERG